MAAAYLNAKATTIQRRRQAAGTAKVRSRTLALLGAATLLAACGSSPCEDEITIAYLVDQAGYTQDLADVRARLKSIDAVSKTGSQTVCEADLRVAGAAGPVVDATLGGIDRHDKQFAVKEFRAGINSARSNPSDPPRWPQLVSAYEDILTGPQIRAAANGVLAGESVNWRGRIQYSVSGGESAPPKRWRWVDGDNPIFHAAAALESLARKEPALLASALRGRATQVLEVRKTQTRAKLEAIVAAHAELKTAGEKLAENERILDRVAAQWEARLRKESFSKGANDVELRDLSVIRRAQQERDDQLILQGVVQNFTETPLHALWIGIAVHHAGDDEIYVEPREQINLGDSPLPGMSQIDFSLILSGDQAQVSSVRFLTPTFRESGRKNVYAQVIGVERPGAKPPEINRFQDLPRRLRLTRAHINKVGQEINYLEGEYQSAKARFEKTDSQLARLREASAGRP